MRLIPPAEVSEIVAQAETGPELTNETVSKDLPPVPSPPGHALGVEQSWTKPFRPSRPEVVSGSAGSRLPLAVWVGSVSVQVGKLKVLTVLPPVKLAVNVNWIGVPHTNPGEVLIE